MTARVCTICDTKLGDEARVHPVSVGDETFCPRCFHFKRAPQEPVRWNGGAAVFCPRCRHQTLAYGVKTACGACGNPHVNILSAPRD